MVVLGLLSRPSIDDMRPAHKVPRSPPSEVVLCAVNCFSTGRPRGLHDEWKRLVDTAVESQRTRLVHIDLDMEGVLSPAEDTYNRECDKFQQITLVERRRDQKNVKERLRQLLRRSEQDEAKPQLAKRYIFILGGLVIWVLRDIMCRPQSPLALETVLVIYVGFRDDTSLYLPPIRELSEHAEVERFRGLDAYVSKVKDMFEVKRGAGQNVFYLESCQSKVIRRLELIDEGFTQLREAGSIASVTRQITTTYRFGEDGRPGFWNFDRLLEDTQKWIQIAARAVENTAASTEIGVVRSRIARQLGAKTSTGCEPSPSRFPLETPGMSVAKARQVRFYTLPVSDNLVLKNIWAQADQALGEGDLKNADRLFNKCVELCPEEPIDDWLKLNLAHSTVRLHLGHYAEARRRLRKILKTVECLQSSSDLHTPQGINNFHREVLYRYTTALTRLGEYRDAQQRLTEMYRIIPDTPDTPDTDPEDQERVHMARREQIIITAGAYRLGALVSTYLGTFDRSDMGRADEVCDKFKEELQARTIPTPDEAELETLGLAIQVTKSKMLILEGDHKGALDKLGPVLVDLSSRLGPRNFLSLEARSLTAMVHVLTSKALEGEILCNQTLAAVTGEVGPGHPFAMEATFALIMAYRAQGRLNEALGISQDLYSRARASASFDREDNPQALRYLNQLGSLQAYVGNYLDAEKNHELAYHQALEVWPVSRREGPTNASPWKYLSDLAWAQLHLGKPGLAKKNIRSAFLKQLRIYASRIHGKLALEDDEKPAKTLMRDLDLMRQLVNPDPNSTATVILHPDFLYTVYVIANIELSDADPDMDFILDVMEGLKTLFTRKVGTAHEWTLEVVLMLGRAYSAKGHTIEDGSECFGKAKKMFESVVQARRPDSHLDKEHPLILRGKRDSAVASILSDDLSVDQFYAVKQTLKDVALSQKQKPGASHPDTLKTLLHLLSVEIALTDPGAERTRKELLSRLRSPQIQRQRIAESLLLQERIANIYCEAGLLEPCAGILDGLKEDIANVDGIDSDFVDITEALRSRVDDLAAYVRNGKTSRPIQEDPKTLRQQDWPRAGSRRDATRPGTSNSI